MRLSNTTATHPSPYFPRPVLLCDLRAGRGEKKGHVSSICVYMFPQLHAGSGGVLSRRTKNSVWITVFWATPAVAFSDMTRTENRPALAGGCLY